MANTKAQAMISDCNIFHKELVLSALHKFKLSCTCLVFGDLQITRLKCVAPQRLLMQR